FFNNCTKIGLLPVVLPEDDVRALMEAGEAEGDLEGLEGRCGGGGVRGGRGDEVRALREAGEAEVDLEALEVRFDGRAVPFELDREIRRRLLEGLDEIALAEQEGDGVAAHEGGA